MADYSFSRLMAFEQCPYKYKCTYMDHHKGTANAFSQYGILCHSVLERCARGEIESYEMLDEYELGFSTEITEKFPPNNYVDLATSYYKDGEKFFSTFDGFDNMDVVEVEGKFSIEMEHPEGNYNLNGVVDLLYKDSKGDYIVRDWKSKSRFANSAEQKKYARQLYTYAEYVNRTYGTYPKTMEFYMFRKGKTIPVKFNPADLQETIDWMNSVVSKINAEKEWKPVYDDWFCSWLCDFRFKCSYNKK